MAGILDLIDPRLLTSEDAPSAEGEFSKGMRSGTLGMRSQASNFAGAIGEKLGYQDFAQSQYADADALGMRAAAAAPRVNTWRDIGKEGNYLRDAGDWAAGTLGQLVPSAAVGIGAGLAAPAVGLGGGALGAIAAGTAAYAPLETGDAVGRMREAGQPVDLGRAAMGGGASALGASLVPGLVGAKVAGRMAGRAPTSLRRAVVTDAGLEGGTEFGGELAKQLGSTQTLDTLDYGAATDNAVAGVLGGGVLGGVGHVAQRAHQNVGAVGQGIQGVKDAATGLYDRAKGSDAGKAAAKVAEKIDGYEIPETLSGLFKDAKDGTSRALKQMANSEDFVGDTKQFMKDSATWTKDKLQAAFADNDKGAAQRAMDAGNELMNDNLSPETRQKLTGAMSNLGDKTSRAAVATAKLLKDGYSRAASSAKEFTAAFKGERAKSAEGVKKSEDESAFYGRISEHVTPVLRELRPDLFEGSGPEHDKLMRGVMGGIRNLITTVANGDRVEGDQLTALMQFTHGKADKLITAAYKVVDSGDKKQARNVLAGINTFADAQRGHGTLTKTIQDSLLPEHAGLTPAEINDMAFGLWKWASTANKAQGDPRFLLRDREVRDQLQTYFGDKTDTVMAAIEKEHARTQSAMGDEVIAAARAEFDSDETMGEETGPTGETNPTGEEGLTTTRTKSVDDTADTIQIFAKGGKELYEKPDPSKAKVDSKGVLRDHDTIQAMRRAALRYPDMGEPEWIGAGELGMDHPLVKQRYETLLDSFLKEPEMSRADAEARAKKAVGNFGVISVKGTKQETRIGEHELPHVLLDTSKTSHLESPARIDTVGKGKSGNTVIDAIRLTNFMERRLHDSKDDWSARDEKGAQHRKARMFMEGIAAVQDHLQVSFEIPDSTVLEKTKRGPDGEILRNKDGSPKGVLTWGKARKLLALGKDDVTLAKDAEGARVAYMIKQAEHDTLQAGRPLRKDGKQAWYPRGSEQAKALTRTGYEVERAKGKAKFTQEQVHRAAMYRLIDEAGQADGGYATNKTLLDIASKISEDQPEVAKLLREKVQGRDDSQRVDDLHESEGRYEAGSDQSVTKAMAGGNRKEAQIRTDSSGLPRSESTIGYSEPAKVAGKDPNQRAWAKWVDDTLRLPTAAETIATIKELDKDQLMNVKARLNHLSGMLGSDGLRGIGPLRLKQYTTQVDAALARLDAATSTGSGARRVDRRQATLAARAAPPSESDLTLRGEDAEGSLPGTDQPYPPRPQAGPGEGATKGPKALAAKKAALSKEAASGDPALLKELSTSTDAKGLQRAVEHLNAGEADANTSKAIDAANARLGELVRGDESVAYGLQTKRYSMMGYRIHAENGYSGFAATHDSPIRHEGRFDWREHAMKGEGAMVKGAGTYLSTGEGVHKYYKKKFTAEVAPEAEYQAADRINLQLIRAVGARTEVGSDTAKIAASKGKNEAVAFVQRTIDEHFKDGPESTISQAEFDKWTGRYEKLLNAITAMPESEMRRKSAGGHRADKSPTYEVSVNIADNQLMVWDQPLSKQSAEVQKAALKAAEDLQLDLAGPFGVGNEFVLSTRGEDFYRALSDHFAPGDRDKGDRQASDYLQAAGILGHRMKASAKDGVQNPNYVIYDDSKISTNYVHFSLMKMDRKPVMQDKEALDLMAKMGWHFDELSLERFSTRARETAWRAMLNEALTIKDVRDASRLNDGTWNGKGRALSHLNKVLDARFGDVSAELQRRMKELPSAMDLAAEHFGSIPDTRTAGEKARDEMANRSRTIQIATRTDKALEDMAHGRAEGEVWQDRAEADLEGETYDEANYEKDLAFHYGRELKKLQAERERARKEAPGWEQHADRYDASEDFSFSQQDASRQDPNSPGADAATKQAALDHIAEVAPWVQAAFYKHVLDADGNKQIMTHAGEFERVLGPTGLTDVMRLSMYSMTPMHHAYHESLHAFFAKLRDLKQGGVMDVLEKAGSSAPVMNQLKKLLAGEPEALKQLNNPEERAAYMYQFWSIKDANGKRMLTVGDQAKNVLQRIADFIRSALGIWSNDERALKTMEYLNSGEFAKDVVKRGASDVVSRKIIEAGRNQTLAAARRMTQPFLDMGAALGVAGGQRLRDTGIPALRELADAMKLHGTAEGDDHGFLPAAHREHIQRMNALAHKLKGVDPALMRAALESLQSKSNDPITALPTRLEQVTAKQAKRLIRDHLDETFDYMRDAGVKVNDMGYGKDYFPRVYDTTYISKHQDEFQAVLAKHGVSDALGTMRRIMVADGNEFMVEVDKPGMQHLKERKLGFIPDAELAPFMKKDVLDTLNSYTAQATRRAEWARRFKDDGSRISQLLMRAKREGATPEQLATADKFIRSVDGTLGDTINPEARHLMGNMMVYQNIRLLPLAVFSSVVDPMGVVVNGGTVRDAFNAFKRGLKEVVKPFKKNPKDDEATRFAEEVGVIDNAMLADALSGMYLQGMAGDTARRINDGFFKWNLMSQWNKSMRVGATEAAMGFLRKHADGKATKHSQRFLNELGLQPGELQLDARGRVKVTQADGLSLEQSARVKAAINRWVDGAVLRPDAVDKPIWMSDPHFALIAHLKQFVYSFHETILKRVAHEYQNGNYAPAMALASYVPIMLAADLAKGLIQGGGEQPEWKAAWGIDDYLLNATERAGLFGTSQFAIDALQGGVGALAGPTLEQLGSAVQVMGGAREFAPFVLKSMPANALYGGLLEGGGPDPKYKV